jgi:N-acetylmuramoyl-L-alanine amidase
MTLRSLVAATVGALLLASTGAALAAPPTLVLSADDRDALTRVAFAEAGNQGDSGIAAVVQTILNRLVSGGWGASVEAVVDAPHQFEPVSKAGGDWRRLPAPSVAQRARVETILSLIADGRLPDFIGGALYFQNPKIVAARVAAGTAPADRLNFGGRSPVAVVGAHAFYASQAPAARAAAAVDPIFIGGPAAPSGPPTTPSFDRSPEPDGDPGRAIFILANGRLAEDLAAPNPHP